jgi:DNA polymerase-1
MARPTLLIDADVVAFQCAAACETALEWEPGHWTWNVNFNEVTNAVLAQIERMMDALDGHDYKLCITDPKHNFRLDVLPTYKTHRKTVKKPLVLLAVKQWMIDELGGVMRPSLEGDDVMGIFATYPSKRDKIIVSIDKDMKTIPCTYVKDISEAPVEITEDEADWYHLYQTLMGDGTDGYKGCPQVGAKRASEIIELGATIADNWAAVVETYASKGLGEEEALRQARVARILRASDYDFKKKEPILWTP